MLFWEHSRYGRKKLSGGENNMKNMDRIRRVVREWTERHRLLPPGVKIVAACSGGPDSLALVDLLADLRSDAGFQLFVAHVDHGLRGQDSERDAEFVRDFCTALALPFFCERIDVKGEIRRCGGSLEEVARKLRYEQLRRIAAEVGGAWIATGHHRDDQAETLLLNLLRGSGSRGLGAMRPRRGDVIRPLLCLNRTEILQYCYDAQLQPRYDASNDVPEFFRNRLRHELIPLMQREFSPALTDVLCRTADVLADEQQFVSDYVEQNVAVWSARTDRGYRLDGLTFSGLAIALQRELLRNLLEKIRGDTQRIGFTHVEQIRTLFLQEHGSRRLDLPGYCQARKSYRELFLETIAARGAASTEQAVDHDGTQPLDCPGETAFPEWGIVLRCTLHTGNWPETVKLGPTQAAFDRESVRGTLLVRGRRPGDLFRPLGAPGARKLKKIMIDQKIPLEQRDSVPILCDAEGILWVVGRQRSERGRLSANTREYIMVETIPYDSKH